MFTDRNRNRDLAALLLLVATLLLAAALATYDRADPVPSVPLLRAVYSPDRLVEPVRAQVHNACGPIGAVVAEALLALLGAGAYYVLLSLGILGVRILGRPAIDDPVRRLAGWLLSALGFCSLLELTFPQLGPGPAYGAGGYAGVLVGHFLTLHFAPLGGFLLALAALAAGWFLCTDYLLMRLMAVSLRSLWQRRQALRRPAPRPARAAARTSSKGDSTVSVRIRGKAVAETGEVDAEAENPQWDGSEEDEEAEAEGDEESWEEEDEVEDEEAGDVEEDEDEGAARPAAAASTGPSAGAGAPAFRTPKSKSAQRSERDDVIEKLEEAESRRGADHLYELPPLDLLQEPENFSYEAQEKEVRRKAKILEKTFRDFGFNVRVVEIETGPVIAQYEVELEAGLRLSKITGLADDLAIALRVPSVRIVAPIPGKNTVGIEVPNQERQVVRLREVMQEVNGRVKKMRIPLFLGKDVSGNPLAVDLSTMPHLLIAGRTGTGKSVCLNAIISSILMTRTPDEVRMLMIDPKMVELSGYRTLPHLMHPVVTDMRKAEAILAWAVDKMEERYALLARAGVRHLASYNQLSEEELVDRLQPESEDERRQIPLHLPYIVIVADEMADLMMTAGKEVEQHIIRLAQKSRAVGIHLILATQKPTVDVITGLIKSNLPARLCFQVASRTDSRVVLDEMGADKLLGNGDMLFLWPGTSTLLRGQGTYLSDEEIEAIVDFVSTGEQEFVTELVHMKVSDGQGHSPEALKSRDELYEAAIEIVIREGRGSVSLLQRALGIGYGRAARLIDFMAEDGIVGPYNGSQAREVTISLDDFQRMQGAAQLPPPDAAPALPQRRSNKIRPEPEREPWDATPARRALTVARPTPDDGPEDESEEPGNATAAKRQAGRAAGARGRAGKPGDRRREPHDVDAEDEGYGDQGRANGRHPKNGRGKAGDPEEDTYEEDGLEEEAYEDEEAYEEGDEQEYDGEEYEQDEYDEEEVEDGETEEEDGEVEAEDGEEYEEYDEDEEYEEYDEADEEPEDYDDPPVRKRAESA